MRSKEEQRWFRKFYEGTFLAYALRPGDKRNMTWTPQPWTRSA
jgi:hypothetical protein